MLFCRVSRPSHLVKLSLTIFFPLLQATGARLGTLVSTVSSIGTGVIIGFIFSWKLTLGILAFVPFILAAGVLQMKMLGGYTKEGNEALEHAGKVCYIPQVLARSYRA